MRRRAFQEEFRVGAPDVVSVQGKSIGKQVLLRETIADLTDPMGE
jgi:hypothetical protein